MRNTGGGGGGGGGGGWTFDVLMAVSVERIPLGTQAPNVLKKWNGEKNDAADIIGATATFLNFSKKNTQKNDNHNLLYRKKKKKNEGGRPVVRLCFFLILWTGNVKNQTGWKGPLG